jgi:putative transposase
MIHGWKKRLVEGAAEVFETRSESKARGDGKSQEGELYEQIGRLKMELEWLKKKADQLG